MTDLFKINNNNFKWFINRYNEWSIHMEKINKIVNLAYQLTTIIIQILSFLLLNIYILNLS